MDFDWFVETDRGEKGGGSTGGECDGPRHNLCNLLKLAHDLDRHQRGGAIWAPPNPV